MVPPPNNTGDEFPDFDSMTPEEQLAWLESLAKRQGVSDDELITAADVDVPIPEDAEVDEPGYVPFEGSRSAREAQEAASAAPEPELPTFEHEEEELTVLPDQTVEAVASSADLDLGFEAEPGDLDLSFEAEPAAEEPQETAEPLFWLDSLAVQPENLGDLDLFSGAEIEAAEEPAVRVEEGEAVQPPGPAVPEPESALLEEFDLGSALEEAADREPAPAASDDLLGGMDPMLWLESLAMRQGARKEELLTSADLEIAEVSEDAVVDEPGYVPFEGSRSARETQQVAASEGVEPEAAEVEPEPVPEVFEEIAPPESMPEEEAADLEAGWPEEAPEIAEAGASAEEVDLFGGADPLTWLESLAKRQGAKEEELITAADLDIPEVPEGTPIDEPGYVAYSAFSILPSEQEIEYPERAESDTRPLTVPAEDEQLEEPAAVAESGSVESADESFSWLEDLAAEPDEDLVQFLAVEEEAGEGITAEETVESARPAKPVAGDPLAGMTDEEVAYAQAHGLLTGEQELAWLKRQAAKLAEARQSQEMAVLSEEELEPAQPVEQLPEWLMGMRPEEEQEVAAETDELLTDLELPSGIVEPADWLPEPAVEVTPELPELPESDAAEVSLDADVESLWAETSEEKFVPAEETVSESELEAFLEGRLVPTEPDLLAEALDAEFDRKLEGDESEPGWYTDAVAKIAAEAPPVTEVETEEPAVEEVPPEPVLTPGAPVDMPDWLVDKGGEPEVAAVSESEVPSWLTGTGEEPTAVFAEVPSWLTEGLEEQPVAEPGVVPDWLSEFDKAPQVPSEPETAAVPKPEPEPPPAKSEEPPARAAIVEPAIPAPARVESIPEGELFDEYRRRLQENPSDHPNRLALARALHTSQELASSLNQYETLLEASQLLQDVSDDLMSLVETHPEVPRVRRLLGDAHMRRGMLQEALDAYRSALDQL